VSKYGLDKFYTKPEIVGLCLDTIDCGLYDYIIEPSVGSGAFFNKINHSNKIGIDLKPELTHISSTDIIITHDFLTWELNKFPYPKNILIIGNPPFGRNGSLALKFIKKACQLGADIAFILPRGYKKQSVYDKIPLNYEKTFEIDLPYNSFYYNDVDYDVPCVWQIYKKGKDVRNKSTKATPKYFKFTDRLNADLAIRRVGALAGKVFSKTDVSESSHYFIKCELMDLLLTEVNTNLFSNNDTTGPRSISKNELISVIDGIIDEYLNNNR
jgi:hypothetical protein